MDAFKCLLPKVLFGCGEFQNIAGQAGECGRTAFVAIDPYLHDSGFGERIKSLLQNVSVKTILFSEIDPDPDCFGVDSAADIAREHMCDLVIALGGGSTIDFGKGVAVIAANPGVCWEYTRRKDHTPREPGAQTLPVIALPTTAGTGSEITPYAVFSNSKIKEKSTIVSERIVPRLAIVDPELTYSCSPRLTALSGVDVLAHSIEAYINIHASPWARLVALEAIRLVAAYLPIAVKSGDNHQARRKMAWASTLAGIAIAHANPTLPHALGQAAGGYIHAPHGGSVAACLAQILNLSYTSAPERFAEIAVAMDPAVGKQSLEIQAQQAAALVEKLLQDIQVTVKFGDFGMKAKDIDRITEIALTGYFTGISCHPKQVTAAEIKQIYRDCL